MALPENRLTEVNSLCELGPQPLIMTGLLRLTLLSHYSNADNIEHAVFRERLFKEGDTTGIRIEDASVWTPTRTGKQPAIIIRRDDWKFIKKAISDSRSGTTPEGDAQYTTFWQGSHTLFCAAPSKAEAEILAAETYRYLQQFGPILRQQFGLGQFGVVQVGSLGPLEEDRTLWVVPITIGYGWAETWIIRRSIPPIQRITWGDLFSGLV